MPRIKTVIIMGSICLLAAASCDPGKGGPGKPGNGPPAVPLGEAAGPAAGQQLVGDRGALGGYPRYPDYHSGVVVFSAEGDLWQVAARGGLARRLTTHPGKERFARFSPDGKWLAFTGQYDGNHDVFVMPAAGGVPRRLTYHPGMDMTLGWTPDGKSVLFRSTRHHAHGNWTLHTVALAGGDPARLPLSRAARLSYEPGGKRVAINRLSRDFRRWKRYAGGKAVQIFVGDLAGGAFRKATTFLGTNAYPMWHGDRIYFLSDRTGTQNIWSMKPVGTDLRQHTRASDYDARFPSLNQGKIVFQRRAELYLLDLETDKVTKVPVQIISDALRTRVRFTSSRKYAAWFGLSPDGRTFGLEVRGNLHLLPAAKEGRRVQLTATSAARARGLSFSPDGKEIATISDETGESEVFIIDTSLKKPPRQVTTRGTRFKHSLRWSPDGEWLTYSDSDNRLFIVPARGGPPLQIDRGAFGRIFNLSWSPDGKWLAYVKLDSNYFASIFLKEIQRGGKGKIVRVTSQYFNDWNPAWSPDGKYLYFLSIRTINPYIGRLDFETILDKATKPYMVLLSSKTRSPFLPRSPGDDKDKEDEAGKDDARKKGKGKKGKVGGNKKPDLVKVDLDVEGLAGRVVEVPAAAGHYYGLWAGKGFIMYLEYPTQGMADWAAFGAEDETSAKLVRFDLEKKKAEVFMGKVDDYDVSRDGEKILIKKKKSRFYAFDLKAKAPSTKKLKDRAVPIGKIREVVNPRQEWRQIFDEVWRMMRDHYWSADMGGVDWAAVRKKYRGLLPRIVTRDELEDLLGEMVAELSMGHTYVWGGDKRPSKHVSVGLLGADLTPHSSGYYAFGRIYPGVNWDKKRRSPLTLSHVNVKEGDFLIRLDGRPIKAGDNVYSRLQKAAGELVQLTVSSTPSERGARDVEISTLKSERSIRYYTWVKANREAVDKKTKGRVGYIHIPDMMTDGMVAFDRWFYPQVRKEGLIVDGRWNRGGFVSQLIVKRLTRKVLSWSKARSGWMGPYPDNTFHGKIVVLTNESAGSDGDIFARAIQVAKVGPVIGTRTWGGVVGINLSNRLVDKGISTRPGYFAWWDLKRRWGVEGEGVTPDVVVFNDPGAMDRGVDAQLERGIAEILARLKKDPPRPPDWGKLPDKTKKAWVEKYGKTDKP